MVIHNFFHDVLLSIRTLFDSTIFPNNFIKSYHFNIANRSFQLSKNGYKTQYEFPTCLIRFNDDQYSFGERPNVCQNILTDNINQIPVLYDTTTLHQLILQEEHSSITTSVTINCESQLQAMDVEHRVKRYLPLNKFMSLINFSSFLEVQPEELLRMNINYNDNEIINLFTKMDNKSGHIIYCYAVNYNPLIRLDSCSVSLGDGQERSFPVNLELTYYIQVPVWAFGTADSKEVTRINLDFTKFGFEPISENSCKPIYNQNPVNEGDVIQKVQENRVVYDSENWNTIRVNLAAEIHDELLSYICANRIQIDELRTYISELQTSNIYLQQLLDSTLTVEDIQYIINTGCIINNSLYENVYSGLLTDTIIKQYVEGAVSNITIEELKKNGFITQQDLEDYVTGLNTFDSSNNDCLLYFPISDRLKDKGITSEFTFNIFDTTGTIIKNIDTTLDYSNDYVIFKFDNDDYISRYNPDLTKPVIVQVVQNIIIGMNSNICDAYAN